MALPPDVRTVSVQNDDDLLDERLDVYLAERIGISRSRVKNLLRDGHVEHRGGSKIRPSYKVMPGDSFTVLIPDEPEPDFAPENIPLDIVYQDSHLLVVNKPAGMVVHPGRGNVTGTLAGALLYHVRNIAEVGDSRRPGIVHRLDRETSGLLVVALTADMHTALSDMIREREVERVYTAYVWGTLQDSEGVIDAPLGRHPSKGTLRAVIPGGRRAVTHYTVKARYDFLTELSVKLDTGRTHQIRVHLAHIGHHVFGDPMYGGREERLKGFTPEIRQTARRLLKLIDRQALHAARLSFRHPATGEQLSFEVQPPEDIIAISSSLRKE